MNGKLVDSSVGCESYWSEFECCGTCKHSSHWQFVFPSFYSYQSVILIEFRAWSNGVLCMLSHILWLKKKKKDAWNALWFFFNFWGWGGNDGFTCKNSRRLKFFAFVVLFSLWSSSTELWVIAIFEQLYGKRHDVDNENVRFIRSIWLCFLRWRSCDSKDTWLFESVF